MHPAQLQLFTYCNLHPPRLQQRRLQKLRLLMTEAFHLKLVLPSAICLRLDYSSVVLISNSDRGILTSQESKEESFSYSYLELQRRIAVTFLNKTWSIILLKESTCAKERESAESGLSVLQPQPQQLYSDLREKYQLFFTILLLS